MSICNRQPVPVVWYLTSYNNALVQMHKVLIQVSYIYCLVSTTPSFTLVSINFNCDAGYKLVN